MNLHFVGLFHQIIAQSGSDQAVWAVNGPGQKPERYTRDVSGFTGLIPGLRPANERRRYFVTTSLIGLAQA